MSCTTIKLEALPAVGAYFATLESLVAVGGHRDINLFTRYVFLLSNSILYANINKSVLGSTSIKDSAGFRCPSEMDAEVGWVSVLGLQEGGQMTQDCMAL